MKHRQESDIKRKQDTRRKIQMGGLIITSKLDGLYEEDKAILYGILLEAKARLNNSPELKESWKSLGIKEFSKDKQDA